ncbi:MAG: hypothetical protein AB7T49_19395 [Oligoflexales bacterium]
MILLAFTAGVPSYADDQCPDTHSRGDAILVRYYASTDCQNSVEFQTHYDRDDIEEYCSSVTSGLSYRINSIKVYGECDNIPGTWPVDACLRYAR